MHNRIVIVGGGFCGTVLAAHLLRRPPARVSEIVIVERRGEIGRGVAYAVRDWPYLLNVPASRLSADSRDPWQFLHFAQRTLPDADGEDFLPRRLYGDYLQDFLARAERDAPAHVRCSRVYGEVTSIAVGADGDPLRVGFADGECMDALRVILAPGNPPASRLPWAVPVKDHPAFRDDPWASSAPVDHDAAVLIIGNGLTMADVVSSLMRDATRTPRLMTISRRGLTPLPQSTFHAAALRGDGSGLLDRTGSVRALMSAIRTMARDLDELGGDWRQVITFVRGLAPRIWERMPDVERRRFLRHVQSHWDVHRHRLPPQVAAQLDRLRRSGRLQINAGRIESLTPAGNQLRVAWRRRGGMEVESMLVDAVINATGPDYSLVRSADTLLRALRGAGHVSEDALHLGLRTSAQGACIGADGGVRTNLFYVGPMLRAGHWEATAATELGGHAERLAQHLAASDVITGDRK